MWWFIKLSSLWESGEWLTLMNSSLVIYNVPLLTTGLNYCTYLIFQVITWFFSQLAYKRLLCKCVYYPCEYVISTYILCLRVRSRNKIVLQFIFVFAFYSLSIYEAKYRYIYMIPMNSPASSIKILKAEFMLRTVLLNLT